MSFTSTSDQQQQRPREPEPRKIDSTFDFTEHGLAELKFWFEQHAATKFRIFEGLGTPEGVVIADRGALFLRKDGSTSTTLYVKTAGDGLATGWTAK